MLTVGNDVAEVERQLREGQLACPECGTALSRWGYARVREVRLAGGAGWRVRPRRSICGGKDGCGQTHVLLPAGMLARRADSAAVIGAALASAAAGLGHRAIAGRLGVAAATVRGWLRRLALRALGPDPLLPGPSGSALADAVAAILAAAAAVARRWLGPASVVSPWELASAVTSGSLLGPGTAVQLINTSCPW